MCYIIFNPVIVSLEFMYSEIEQKKSQIVIKKIYIKLCFNWVQNILGLNVIRHESGFCYLISLHFCFNVKTDHYDIFYKTDALI